MKSESQQYKKITIPPHVGLTSQEVATRKKMGKVNQSPDSLLKSNGRIIFENSVTLFNLLNVFLASLVFFVGSPKNALFLLIIIINSSIGIFQEIRAKRTIEKLSVLSETKVHVIRDYQMQEISPENIVLDDVLYLSAGDQIPVDSRVIETAFLEVDESLLTGEADRIMKQAQDELFSGSFVTAGEGFVQATAVGAENYAAKLTQNAQKNRKPTSELMKTLRSMTKVLTFIIIPLGAILFYSQLQTATSTNQAVLGAVAALVSVIPEGLVLLTGVAFAVGSANLARKKVLVQSLPAIETLARVDTLCLDKTGTITDGTLSVEQVIPALSVTENETNQIMTELMSVLSDQNATAEALRGSFSGQAIWQADNIYPFSSARKWSGATFKEQGSFVLGAAEYIFPTPPDHYLQESAKYLEMGQRVLVLAKVAEIQDDADEFTLKVPELVAILILSDTLRENAVDTFRFLRKQGLTLKVISGDHPLSVSKIAQSAGIKNAEKYLDLSQIGQDADYQTLAEEYTVFGRVSPYQKEELLNGLKEGGHITCMTGDGVNDVLALRTADIGVAMASGSDAARSAADIVLLDSDFSKMRGIVNEGRRVINNIERVASMYLVKTIYSILLAIIFMVLALPYPFAPLQLTPINMFTVGIPSFVLALRPSYERVQGRFTDNILRISVPGAFWVVISVVVVQILGQMLHLSFSESSTISVFLAGFIGLVVLIRVSHPLNSQRILLVLAMGALLLGCFIFLRKLFEFNNVFDSDLLILLPLLGGILVGFPLTSRLMNQLLYWKNNRKKG